MIQFKCECGYEREVSDDSAGKSAKCPKCKTISQVPIPEPAVISHDPADYADDQPYEPDPAEGFKTADRPGHEPYDWDKPHGLSEKTLNEILLGVLLYIRVLAVIGVGLSFLVAILIIAADKPNGTLAAIVLASGLTSSAWTYVGAEAVRLLVEIERNTRKT